MSKSSARMLALAVAMALLLTGCDGLLVSPAIPSARRCPRPSPIPPPLLSATIKC